jgi:hypothetical protein
MATAAAAGAGRVARAGGGLSVQAFCKHFMSSASRKRPDHFGYELEAERVLALARGVRPMLPRIRAGLSAFYSWLDKQAPGG